MSLTIQKIIADLQGRGFTQTEIQNRLRIPQGRLSRWGRGIGVDSANDALQLAEMHRSANRQEDKPAADTPDGVA